MSTRWRREDVRESQDSRGELQPTRRMRAGWRRRWGCLLLMFIIVGLGACGGDLQPDDGPRAPAPDGHPGTPTDDAHPGDGPLDGGVASDADPAP
jgi:hypothetical protein